MNAMRQTGVAIGSTWNFTLFALQMRDGVIKVLDFEADGAAVRAWCPIRRAAAEGERAAGDVVFRPLHSAGFAEDHVGFNPSTPS